MAAGDSRTYLKSSCSGASSKGALLLVCRPPWLPENCVVCFLPPLVCSLQAARVTLQRLLGFLPGDPGLTIIQVFKFSF